MPDLIGDSVICFPLINHLIASNISINLISSKPPINSLLSAFYENYRQVYINKDRAVCNEDIYLLDLLCTKETELYFDKYKVSIGFPDANISYNHYLKLPSAFNQTSAVLLFSQAVTYLSPTSSPPVDFSMARKWCFNSQNSVTLIPGSGYHSRSWKLENFLFIYDRLEAMHIKCAILLGPNESDFLKIIPSSYNTVFSDSIEETLNVLNLSKLVVANEGGAMHISGAYGVPLIGLFKVASSKNWFPYNYPFQIAIGEGENNYHNPELHDINIREVFSNILHLYNVIDYKRIC